MNRREAIRAVLAMPAITAIQLVEVKPEDVIVIEYAGAIDSEIKSRLVATLEQIWPPPQRIIVLGNEMKLKVVRRG